MTTLQKLLKCMDDPNSDYGYLNLKMANDAFVVLGMCMVADAIDRETAVLNEIKVQLQGMDAS